VREWWSKARVYALATVNGMIRPCSGAGVLRQKWSRGQIEARLAKMPPCPMYFCGKEDSVLTQLLGNLSLAGMEVFEQLICKFEHLLSMDCGDLPFALAQINSRVKKRSFLTHRDALLI
jgi:hypothetical protein